ncbi:MAG: hypothetical protein JW863_06235, partial [Chitinispirillaceae bacterium]|nr:hypothetical protein [Chitinispirillaceae bacterium]
MDDLLEFLFKIIFLILFILLLPAALLIATPFIFLIPGKEYCTTCGEINCDCGASKAKPVFYSLQAINGETERICPYFQSRTRNVV